MNDMERIKMVEWGEGSLETIGLYRQLYREWQ